MRVRLHGTPAEIDDMLRAMSRVFEAVDVSRIYHDRHPSQLCRCYLTVANPCAQTSSPETRAAMSIPRKLED